MPAENKNDLPGKGFTGWLGRQVAYIKKAVDTEVTTQPPQVLYRKDTVAELPHPEDPNVTLRRTVIDEVIVEKKPL